VGDFIGNARVGEAFYGSADVIFVLASVESELPDQHFARLAQYV
jgi:hypothetical protein